MSDKVKVSRIAVFAHHGLFPEEEKLGQRFYVSVVCSLDLAPAGLSDDWSQSVDYADLTKLVMQVATRRRFRTIEGLAETVAADVLATFAPVTEVMVEVEKPGAPIPAILDGVSVEITRRRPAD